jgi:hypothetical protein
VAVGGRRRFSDGGMGRMVGANRMYCFHSRGPGECGDGSHLGSKRLGRNCRVKRWCIHEQGNRRWEWATWVRGLGSEHRVLLGGMLGFC